MPDLTVETRLFCQSIRFFQLAVPSARSANVYTVERGEHTQYEFVCDCPAFQFRKTCRHIREAEKQWCGWAEHTGKPKPPESNSCPECGGPIFAQGVAV